MSDYKQLSDFAATELVAGTDLIYSENATTEIEQKTTVTQLQYFILSPISNSTSTDAGTLLDSDTTAIGRAGLFQTTMAKIKAYVLSALSTGSSPTAGALTGAEIVPVSRGTGLLQTTTAAIAALAAGDLAPQRQSIPVLTAGQANYVTTGYTPGIINVFIAGVRISPSGYQATDGTNITITDPNVLAKLVPGMTIDTDAALSVSVSDVATVGSVQALDPANMPAVGTLTGAELMTVKQSGSFFQSTLTKIAQYVQSLFAPMRQSIPVTSNGQATYATSGYTVGMIDVFITGIRLNPTQYQALDGANVTITDTAVLANLVTGMTVDITAVVGLSVANAATVGSVNALIPSNQPTAATFTGTEQVSMLQGAGLVQNTLSAIGQWIISTFQGFTQNGTGAVARSIQAELSDKISVKQFGAKGDGVTNDTGSIQAAINAAAALSLALHIPASTYMCTTLTLPSNLVLEGDGVGSVLKLIAGTNAHLLSASSVSSISLRKLVLDGNKANQTAGVISRCFYAVTCNDIVAEDVIVQNATDHGFHVSVGSSTSPLTGSNRVTLTRCQFNNNGSVIGANGGSGVSIAGSYLWATDCYSSGNILDGFKFIGQYVTAKGCHATGNSCGGFTTGFDNVTYPGSVHVYEACYAITNGNGVNGGDGWRHQGQVQRIVHRDCFAIGNTWSGICLLASTTDIPTDVDIAGCTMLNNGQNYSAAQTASPTTVSGAGVALLATQDTSVPNRVRINNLIATDNQSTKTQSYGIQISEGSNVYIGEGCELAGNAGQSVYNASTVTANIDISAYVMAADFIERTMTSSSVTGSTTETTLASILVAANTMGVGQRWRIRGRGICSGTNGSKTFRLYVGSANGLISNQTTFTNQLEWSFEAIVEISGQTTKKISSRAFTASGTNYDILLTDSTALSSALNVSITGLLGNGGDTATVESFFFEPIY
jgi:hypothetical protein